MQLSDEEIDRLRRSGICLDPDGRFIHEGAEVTHGGLRAALWRWLDRDDASGRWVLRLDDKRFVWLELAEACAGAPHLVRSLRWEGDRVRLLLADGSDEELDYASVHLGAGGGARCTVRGTARRPFGARFSTGAWGALGDRIEERAGVPSLVAAGRAWPLAT